MSTNLLEIFGDLSLNEIFTSNEVVELQRDREEDSWIEFPPEDFLEFVASYPRTPFDRVPPSPDYHKEPSFLMVQAHRFWITASRVYRQLQATSAKTFVDLGSYPFFLPFILRDYFSFDGEIVATVNMPLTAQQEKLLNKKRISTALLDLDPLIRDPEGNKPAELNLESGSVDVVLASHVIEHLYHPMDMIGTASRLLRPGGKFIVTTDNARMIDLFSNYIFGNAFFYEPIEGTAAMTFNDWRGHVRFFTAEELTTMLMTKGLQTGQVEFFHCFYSVFFEEYFRQPQLLINDWKKRWLSKTPWLRNDVSIIAEKK
ncbi:MAG: methyltransferase domain-containing protein [Bacteroidetes bacterium]|nr:methyltransferase domain-containing protein [Bacteroidota bacterium]